MIKNSLLAFVTLSLLIHTMFYASLYWTKDSVAKKDEISIEILPVSQPDKKQKQLVEQSKQRINDEIPQDAAFLGQHNQTVKNQTKAKSTGEFQNGAGLGQTPSIKPQAKNDNISPLKKLNGLPTIQELTPKYDFNTPSPSAGIVSRSDDHVPEINEGLETLLSTREFLYYSYYSRIKGRLRQHWGNKVRTKISALMNKGRSIASTGDRVTKVIITLNREGTLVRVQVVGRSGIVDLDDAAVEAFKEAAPFPNPPHGMINGSGLVVIHWDFVLEARITSKTPIYI